MEEKTIQYIPVMPFALMYACISAVIGLLIGIFYAAIFGAVFASIPTSASGIDLTGLGFLFSAAAIVIVPIFAFISGFIGAIIVALVYNFLAPRIGGIKVQFKEEYRPLQA